MSAFVTIEELLADPEPVDIVTGKRIKKKGEVVDATIRVWPRRPTDIEKEMIVGAANAARRALRAKLKDPESEEHRLLLREPLEDADDASLRQVWVQGRLIERAAEMQLHSLEEREVVPDPEGDLIPASVQDAHAEEVEAAESTRVRLLIEAIGSAQRELEAEAESIPHDELLIAAMPAHTETQVQKAWNEAYTNHLIARCTFADKNYAKPYFKTISQVERLKSEVPTAYQTLANTHRGLLLDLEPALGN